MSKDKVPTTSPVPQPVRTADGTRMMLDWGLACEAAVDGHKVTKEEWNNEDIYIFINPDNEKLYIHQPDGNHPLIVRVPDIIGDDYYRITTHEDS